MLGQAALAVTPLASVHRSVSVVGVGIAGSAWDILPDNLPKKPLYQEQPQPFFFIQRDYKLLYYYNQEADPKQVKPRYDEQPQPFFQTPISRFVGIPSYQPPDPLPRKPRYDEQIDHEWMLPIRRSTHGWDFQPDILPRPLKIVDYRPMFFRIRAPSTFGTINI